MDVCWLDKVRYLKYMYIYLYRYIFRLCDQQHFYDKQYNHIVVVSAHLLILVRGIESDLDQTVQSTDSVCFGFLWRARWRRVHHTRTLRVSLGKGEEVKAVCVLKKGARCKQVQTLAIHSAPLDEALSLSPSVGTLLY